MTDQISKFLTERIDAGDFPSAVYIVAKKGEIVLHEALGHAVVEPELIPAHRDTIYDLASMTKVLVTGLLLAKLLERGELSLDDTVSKHLVEFDTDEKRDISVRELLIHTSHLSPWKPLYLCVSDPVHVLDEIAHTSLTIKHDVIYSDLNFIALGKLAEKIADCALNEAFAKYAARPLNLKDTRFNPSNGLKRRIAACEMGNRYEKQTCIEQGYLRSSPTPDDGAPLAPLPRGGASVEVFREYPIWGEVHDGNAWFMGGVAGHAGLFSTAEEVFKIAQQFLPNYTTLLEAQTCELFRTNFTPGMNEHRSFAFQLATTPESTAGTKMSPQSFGHLGFTGTSLWIDPAAERVFILLTNRTHNHSLPFVNLNATRRHFHDLAIEHLDKNY